MPKKKSVNLTLDPDIRWRGEAMATTARRSFSGYVEDLIFERYNQLKGYEKSVIDAKAIELRRANSQLLSDKAVELAIRRADEVKTGRQDKRIIRKQSS